jgi:hypothetical protein
VRGVRHMSSGVVWRHPARCFIVDTVADFATVWRRIESNAGQQFQTKTGVVFSYHVEGSTVIPDHTGYPLHASQFRLAFDRMPLSGPGEINRLVRGPAYVYAILVDPRIGS